MTFLLLVLSIIFVCLLMIVIIIFNKKEEDVKDKHIERKCVKDEPRIIKTKEVAPKQRDMKTNNSKILKDENECLSTIDNDLIKKHYCNTIIRPNINFNNMVKINVRKENVSYEKLINSYKEDKQNIDCEVAKTFKSNVECKIKLSDVEISYKNFPLMQTRTHYSILTNILNEKPIEKAQVLKKNIEEYHLELIKELNKFKKESFDVIQKDKARKDILEYLTNKNVKIFSDSLLKFNGLNSENDLIFIYGNKIFCLEFISYPFDNSEILIKDNEFSIDFPIKYLKRINPIVNERFFKQYFKEMDVINIFVICNKTVFIKNENITKNQLFIKYNHLTILLERLKDENYNIFKDDEILSRILQEDYDYLYINRSYKILSLIQNLRNSIEYYDYLYKSITSYKDVFETTQNMDILYDNNKECYYIKRRI